MKQHTTLLLIALVALAFTPCACTTDETDLGSNLTDPTTRYNGVCDTFEASAAYSKIDEPLRTSGYSYAIIGNYTDATYGSASSEVFTQVALKQASTSIDFANMIVDSVVLRLVNDGLYPDTTGSYQFHFEVMRLSEAIQTDSTYYSNDSLPVDPTARYFDSTITVSATDTIISLRLRPSVTEMLAYNATATEFTQLSRGIRIRIADDADPGMLAINFAATKTRLTAYYHRSSTAADSASYDFVIGTGATHFMHYSHNYSASVFASADSIDATQQLYIEPLAGCSAYLVFDSAIRAFHAAHPYAVIHHAELILPTAAIAQPAMPERMLATYYNGGVEYSVTDMLSDGFDGRYHTADNAYHILVSQHLQDRLRDGYDRGTKLLFDARRSSAARIVLQGPQSANPPRIAFVYSE